MPKPSPRGSQSSQSVCPPRQKTGFIKESENPGERFVYVVGQKTRLDRGPWGLAEDTPGIGDDFRHSSSSILSGPHALTYSQMRF